MLKADYKEGSNEVFKHKFGNVLARVSYNAGHLQIYGNFVKIFPTVIAFHIFLKRHSIKSTEGKIVSWMDL